MHSEGNPLKLKLYPPLRNVVEGVYLATGGNILEYKAKANALSKPMSSHPSTTLTLQPIQMSKHKSKKEKTMPLKISDKVQESCCLSKMPHKTWRPSNQTSFETREDF
jgi:hypothetical protein